MDDLTASLQARIDEDEAMAKAAARVAGPDWWRDAQYLRSKSGAYLADAGSVGDEELAPFWARHDPACELREIQAKREILAEYERLRESLARYPNAINGASFAALQGVVRILAAAAQP